MSDSSMVIRTSTPGAAVLRRVGGKTYPERLEAKCFTCTSDFRTEIENKLLSGFGYAKIARSLPKEANLTDEHIGEHVRNGHLPLAEGVRRTIIEQRAKELGLSIKDHNAALADHITMARLGVQRVIERMNQGEIEPDFKDGVAFATLILKVEEMAGEDIDTEVMFQTFVAWMQSIRKNTTPEQFRAISDDISANPIVQGMVNKQASIEAKSREI